MCLVEPSFFLSVNRNCLFKLKVLISWLRLLNRSASNFQKSQFNRNEQYSHLADCSNVIIIWPYNYLISFIFHRFKIAFSITHSGKMIGAIGYASNIAEMFNWLTWIKCRILSLSFWHFVNIMWHFWCVCVFHSFAWIKTRSRLKAYNSSILFI